MKRIKWMLLIGIVILGGCQMEDYPETKAFQDEFTREFLVSTEEEEEGYYLFESGTGGYQVLFPKNAVISDKFYEKNGERFESVTFEDYSVDENYYISHDLTFSDYGEDWMDENLYALSTSVNYEGDYEKKKTDNTEIYYAKQEKKYESNEKKRTVYRTFSYIIPKGGDIGLEYIYSAYCYDENESCKIDQKEQEEIALKLMKSVEFLD
ncbi:hypothetical protein [Gracilibacillus lacisalsi]|uniref:hypothetical protein n=1 Tax=Gracilibacillus lacisalsi TaxID=393087 RepID=UPI000380869A|nr:hypothetical protein [Gracilibacillus lacisalsi]